MDFKASGSFGRVPAGFGAVNSGSNVWTLGSLNSNKAGGASLDSRGASVFGGTGYSLGSSGFGGTGNSLKTSSSSGSSGFGGTDNSINKTPSSSSGSSGFGHHNPSNSVKIPSSSGSSGSGFGGTGNSFKAPSSSGFGHPGNSLKTSSSSGTSGLGGIGNSFKNPSTSGSSGFGVPGPSYSISTPSSSTSSTQSKSIEDDVMCLGYFDGPPPNKKKKENEASGTNKPLFDVVDKSWELIDPNPDIYSLFIAFNRDFFYNALGSVEVNYSKRMTSCAGVCKFQPRARQCVVSLSEPLLKLRPRKDLVETLLHEMIHAYLFLTSGTQDRDGHGPEFQSHMHRINNLTGANISVYHSFHDEVRYFQTHWWRCDGPCRGRNPYFGYVKRSMNRAPGPNDFWYSEHQANCGGKFIKIKEPPPKVKESKGSRKPKTTATEASSSATTATTSANRDIRQYFLNDN